MNFQCGGFPKKGKPRQCAGCGGSAQPGQEGHKPLFPKVKSRSDHVRDGAEAADLCLMALLEQHSVLFHLVAQEGFCLRSGDVNTSHLRLRIVVSLLEDGHQPRKHLIHDDSGNTFQSFAAARSQIERAWLVAADNSRSLSSRTGQ